MPGILGLIDVEHAGDAADLFGAMVGRMLHDPSYVAQRAERADQGVFLGHVALGFAAGERATASLDDGDLTVVFHGELHGVEAVRSRFFPDGGASNPAELVARGYRASGRGFFADLNGAFAAAIWDARERRLILTCDRFGLRPLYYGADHGRLRFAQEIKAILADPDVSRTRDLRGVAQFFTFGHLFNEDTLFESVKVVPASGWVTFDADSGRLSVSQYREPGPGPVEPATDRHEALDRFTATFQRAVDRCVEGPRRLGLSLSGGLDSRSLLAAIDTAKHPVSTVSLGMQGSIDVLAAERMAQIKGCSYRRVEIGQDFLGRFAEHLRRMVTLTDGQYLCQCIVMPTLPIYRELGIEALLRGHGGELLHMDKAYNYSLDGRAVELRDEEDLFGWLWRRLRAYMLEATGAPIFAGGLQPEIERLARASLRESLAESQHVQPTPQRIWRHFLSQRLRRETALSMVEFQSVVETRLPFLDNDVIDAISAMPPEWKRGETIQAHLLRRLEPRFLAVTNANTGAPVGAGRLRREAARFRLRLLAKLGVKGYQPYERLGLWLRRELRPLVHDLLLGDAILDGGLFDADGIRRVVREHDAASQNHTYLILALMIFEQGRRSLAELDTGARGRLAPALS